MATEQPITLDDNHTDATILQVVPRLPILSSLNAGWDDMLLHQHRQPPHKTPEHRIMWHTISLYTRKQPVMAEQVAGERLIRQHVAFGNLQLYPLGLEQSTSWNQEIEFTNLYLNPALVAHIAHESVNPDRVELIPQFAIDDPLIQHIVLALQAELIESSEVYNPMFADSAATMLAVRLLKQYSTSAPTLCDYKNGLSPHRLSQVIEYINAHIQQNIKLVELAQVAQMSLYYFCRLFKQSTGMTPYQYIMQQRVERAKRLLKQSDRKISEIALECGFYNQSHFTKLFRQLTRVTPKAYRKR